MRAHDEEHDHKGDSSRRYDFEPGASGFLVTSATATSSGEAEAINYAFRSASQVATSFGYSTLRVNTAIDEQQLSASAFCTDNGLGTSDVAFLISLDRADQSFNRFTGGYTDRVGVAVTLLQCIQAHGKFAPFESTSYSGIFNDHYYANPVTGVAAVAALLTTPWVNKYRLWLTVPGTLLDSFKHEQDALRGGIYCATTDAMISALMQTRLIGVYDTSSGIKTYRLRPQTEVWGVNRCGEKQPARPALPKEVPSPTPVP